MSEQDKSLNSTKSAIDLSKDDQFEIQNLIADWLRTHGCTVHDVEEARIRLDNRIIDQRLFASVTVKLQGTYTYIAYFVAEKKPHEFAITEYSN